MEYGICNLSVVPLRAEPTELSEMVSQVLFGESFEVLEWREKWVKIVTSIDNYTGWIGRLQFATLGHLAWQQLERERPQLSYGAVTQAWKKSDNTILYLPIGSSMAFLEGNTCKIGNEKFEILGPKGDIESFNNTARSFLNAPYLWGGRTHFGIDCSGFTQAVFRLHGINIKRDASQQAAQGNPVENIQRSKLGDLAFFINENEKITHVGILLGKGQIIHASGKVKIDTIDEKGIFSEELKRYTHKLHSIKRFL
jgi:gamma-D-glutamyl-L-lysine dipeptidyl-peptidase